MGHQALRDRGKVTETDSGQSEESDGPQRWPSHAEVGPTTVGPTTKEDIEEYYGREVSSVDELQELQRLERGYGGQVLRWADEGMPIAAMGHKTKMQRFRDRKGTPIPWDIEHFNRLSRMDNTGKVNRDRRRGPDGDTGVPDSVREVISSPGRPLDSSIQRAVEERMGDSLGDVRIHTGAKAAAAADQINARAFTVGNHVAFGAGEYDPESAEGQHVLAHELAHVRQQTGGDLSMLPEEDVQLEIDPDPELEREAEETAQRVMSGGKLGIQKLSDTEVHIQRASTDLLSSAKDKLTGDGSITDKITGSSDDGSQFQSFEGGDLSETVGKLVENQREIIDHVQSQQQGTLSTLGQKASENVVGGIAGLGATAVTQNPVAGFVVGKMLPPMVKHLYGSVYQRGADRLTQMAGSAKERISDYTSRVSELVEQKVDEYLGGSDLDTEGSDYK